MKNSTPEKKNLAPVKVRKKVLIIEDDQWILRILTHLLQQWDFDVISTKNPNESFDLALKCKPDLILLDLVFLNFPDVTGVLLLELFKSTECLKELPVIIISGNLNKENFKKLIKTGANAFIAKPFTERTLFEKISELLGDFLDINDYIQKKASQLDYNTYG